METGSGNVSLAGLMNLSHKNAQGIKKELTEIKFYSHLVHHEKYGYYLIDTGIDSSYQKNPFGTLKGVLVKRYTVGYKQEKGQNIASRLKDKGIDLKGVFLTHLHFDHIAGILDLPKDIDYVIGKGEKYQNYKFLFYGNHLKGIKKLYEIDFASAPKMLPFDSAIDIFGDGALWAISTPGHTKGHISYLVNSVKGPTLIAGDACSIKRTMDIGVGPGNFSIDTDKAENSFIRLSKLMSDYPQIRLICGHEL